MVHCVVPVSTDNPLAYNLVLVSLYNVVFFLTYLCVYVSVYWQGFQQVSLVLVVPLPQIYINELQKSDNVTGWKWLQVGQQNVTQRSRV